MVFVGRTPREGVVCENSYHFLYHSMCPIGGFSANQQRCDPLFTASVLHLLIRTFVLNLMCFGVFGVTGFLRVPISYHFYSN